MIDSHVLLSIILRTYLIFEPTTTFESSLAQRASGVVKRLSDAERIETLGCSEFVFSLRIPCVL